MRPRPYEPEHIDMSNPIQRGLHALLDAVGREYVDASSLRAVDIPARFATLDGRLGDRALRLVTQVFTGGAIERLTVAAMSTPPTSAGPAALVSCTVSALPVRGASLPILGLDYVALGGGLSLVAFDLSPTDVDTWADARNNIVDLSRRADIALRPRPRPEFVDQTFSPLAVFARADRDAAAFACELGVTLLTRHARLCEAPAWLAPTRARLADARVDQWCAAMRRNKKESRALQRIFGPIAVDYLEDFLFTREESPARWSTPTLHERVRA
ncbi:MAG: hypothetical protein H6713_41925 [Myxococcales bacterium]|nr:hypothetical protein [Myxococcales bacterium]